MVRPSSLHCALIFNKRAGKDKTRDCDNRRWSRQWLDLMEAVKHLLRSALHQRKVIMTVLRLFGFAIVLAPCKVVAAEKYCKEFHKMQQNLLWIYIHSSAEMRHCENAWPHVLLMTKNSWLSWNMTPSTILHTCQTFLLHYITFSSNLTFSCLREMLPKARRCKRGIRRYCRIWNPRIICSW